MVTPGPRRQPQQNRRPKARPKKRPIAKTQPRSIRWPTICGPIRTAVTGAVAAGVRLGQLHRVAGGAGADRARADPGDRQPRLALEEPLHPDAAGRPALGRVRRRTASPSPGCRWRSPPSARRAAGPSCTTASNETTSASGGRLMPAMPPPLRPCGRTSLAGNRSSDASEVTKASVSAPSVSQVAPSTSSPSCRLITSNSSERTGHSGAQTLTTPCRVPSARPGEPVGAPSGARPTTCLPRLQRHQLGGRHAAAHRHRAGLLRQHRQRQHVGLERPAGAGHQQHPAAGGGVHDRAYRVVLDPAAAAAALGRLLALGGGPGDQPGRGEDDLARVVGHLERAGRRGGRQHLLEVAVDQRGAPRARRTRTPPRPARRRRPA